MTEETVASLRAQLASARGESTKAKNAVARMTKATLTILGLATATSEFVVPISIGCNVTLKIPVDGLSPDQWATFDQVLMAMRPGLTSDPEALAAKADAVAYVESLREED